MLDEEPSETVIDLGPATERAIAEGEQSPGSPRQGLNITGLRTVSGLGATASRFSGLFSGSNSDDDSDSDSGHGDEVDADDSNEREDEAEGMSPAAASASVGGRGVRRTPSTTEAKERMALFEDDEDEVAEVGKGVRGMVLGGEDRGPFADPVEMGDGSSEEEEELVEIRTRRTS